MSRGNFLVDTTAKAIMTAGLGQLSFNILMSLSSAMKIFQRTKVPICKDNMSLGPMMGARAFAKWGIVFVGTIFPPTHKTRAQYINVASHYLAKWVEAKATTKSNARARTWFLYKYLFTRYEFPIETVSDQGTPFFL